MAGKCTLADAVFVDMVQRQRNKEKRGKRNEARAGKVDGQEEEEHRPL